MGNRTNLIYSVTLLWIGCTMFSNLALAQKADKEELKLAKQSAKEAKKNLKDKDYVEAVRFSTLALRGPLKKKPREKAVEVFSSAYDKLITTSLYGIESLSAAHETFEGENTVKGRMSIVDHYDNLVKGIKAVKRMDRSIREEASIDESTMIDYAPQLAEAKKSHEEAIDLYAEQQYVLGKDLMDNGLKPDSRKAFFAFENIKRYKESYKDADALQAEAKKSATYSIIIYSFVNQTGNPQFSSKEYGMASRIQRKLKDKNDRLYQFLDVKPIVSTGGGVQQVTTTTSESQTEQTGAAALVNALTGQEAGTTTTTTTTTVTSGSRFPNQQELVSADLSLYASFYDPDYVRGEVNKKERERKKTIGKDDEERTVRATYFSYTQSQSASVSGDLFLYNNLTQDYPADQVTLTGRSSNTIKWGSYTGNKKALRSSDEIKSKPSLRTQNRMIEDALDDLANSIESRFRRIFQGM